MIADSLIGELFDDRYRLERRIGSGGMADVFLAADESLDRRVAIKILAERIRATRRSSSGSGVRRRRPPASPTPTSCRSTTAARPRATYYIAMEYLNGRR